MKILLADDERGIRLTLSEDLEDAGHTVTPVEDGEKAMQALQKEKFDCMITDAPSKPIGGRCFNGFGSTARCIGSFRSGAPGTAPRSSNWK